MNTGLVGHIVVLADAVPLLKALETRLKVVLDVDLGQLLGHVAVDVADHLAARLLGVQNVGNRLFTVVEVVQIFIQHTAAVLEQTLLEKAHIGLGVSLVIGDQLGHNLLSVHLDALEVGQMVQTVAFAVNAGRIHAVQVGKLVQHAARCVADTVGEIISHIAQCLRNHACRIGKVKYLDARLCQLLDQLAVFSQRRNRAHGKRNAGSAGRFLTENTQIKCQPLIAHASRVAADTDGRDDVIRIGYRLFRTGGQRELHGRAQHTRNVRRQTAVDAELFRIVIHKYQLIDVQLLRTLCNALCEEHGAYTAAADYR